MIYFTQDPAAERIRAAYREMPALALTLPQAARLWAAAPGECGSSLRQLVSEGLLTVAPDRRYVLRSPHPPVARGGGSASEVAA